MKTRLSILLFVALSHCLFAFGGEKVSYYLFAYFTDNSTKGQQVCYAVSKNGLDFTPLNGGKPVLASDTVSLSGGVRDPHILRCDDGWFRMVLTDMIGSWASGAIMVLSCSVRRIWYTGNIMPWTFIHAMQAKSMPMSMPSGHRKPSMIRRMANILSIFHCILRMEDRLSAMPFIMPMPMKTSVNWRVPLNYFSTIPTPRLIRISSCGTGNTIFSSTLGEERMVSCAVNISVLTCIVLPSGRLFLAVCSRINWRARALRLIN